MKKLNEIIENSNTPLQFQLFDSTFNISAERHIYTELRKKYIAIADEAYEAYMEVERSCKKLDHLVEKANAAFELLIKQAIPEVVSDAISVGILNLDADTVYKEYYKMGFADQFKKAYKAFSVPYHDMLNELEALKNKRRAVDNAADRFRGEVDLSAHLGSAFMNAGDKSSMKKEFKAMFNNDKMRNDLRNGLWNGIANFHLYIVNAFPKKGNVRFGGWTTTDSCNKADASFNNINNAALSVEQKKEIVHTILKNNPYLDNAYPSFADIFPGQTRQFVIMADFFGAHAIIDKVNNDLIAYVNENIGETEADVDYCKSLLRQKLSEVGLSKEAAAPVYAVIQQRSDQLDLEYRTVEGAVFRTRDEADAARASFAKNEDMLKRDCSEFIFRSDYTNHIDAIRALPVPQPIALAYIMSYEQKLNEFDKKCKAAALYEEANLSGKRSIKNRLSSIVTSSEAQKRAWDEVTHNGQYSLSDITAGKPAEKGIMNTAGDIGYAVADKAKATAGKLKGLFGSK